MPAAMLRTLAIVVVAACCSGGAFSAGGRPRDAPASIQGSAASRSADTPKTPLRATSSKQNAARVPAAGRDPYKADRLSSPPATLDTPGQTTILTRQILDDMNATSLRDALRSTAGVTVGR